MPSPDAFAPVHAELVEIRRTLHADPELGLEVPRTAAFVAEKLRSWGVEVVGGIGGHGVVGTIRGRLRPEAPIVGLRADMDALPIQEAADVAWRSRTAGRMHACGHDGHMAMLLGAARHLASTRDFVGTARLIFQPGEEGAGGALAMLADELFDRFPCDAIYGLHNWPGLPVGHFAIGPGPSMAGGAFFDIRVIGRGAHGAAPETGVDAVLAAAQIIGAVQGIVSRALSPLEPAVVSISRVQAGDAYNVMPSTVTLGGTARWLHRETRQKLEAMLARTVECVAAACGASATLDWRVLFAPLHNDERHATLMADAAEMIVGRERVCRNADPVMVSEDFSYMLERVPGAYIRMGVGDTASLHDPDYAFDDAALPFGAALLASLVERVDSVDEGRRGIDHRP